MPVDPMDPTGALAELFDLTGQGQDMQEVLQGVVQFAKRIVPTADEAAVTLIRQETAATVATTGGLADVFDELQYGVGYGPCLDAGRANETLLIADTATETRWPEFVPAARERGLGSSLSLPIPVEHYLVGALNLYAHTPRAFDPDTVALGDGLALHLCAALTRAETRLRAHTPMEHLQLALDSRVVIEQAKGIVMAQRHCTAVEAFTWIRTMSMKMNAKVANVAASIVSNAAGDHTRPSADNGNSTVGGGDGA
jgi:GAF domain-containing protein